MFVAATREDYLSILLDVEAKFRLKYVLNGMFESPDLQVFHSANEIEALGVATKGNSVLEARYMMVDADTPVVAREIPQRKGGMLYATDYTLPFVTLESGGVFEDRCLVWGRFSTLLKHPWEAEVMNQIRLEVRKRFVCINKLVWLGPEALKLFEGGMRCTQDFRSSAEFDLKR